MIQVYTPSRNLVANGIHGSCISEDDGSELSVPALSFVSKYVSKRLAQGLADFGMGLGSKDMYVKVKGVINQYFF